jgi:predicted metal-dependent phosphoesterase TrpH
VFADFHLHSTCSDGRLTPAQVIDAVADAGGEIVALTDHDTTAGLEAAAAQAKQLGVNFVNGIEMTTYARGEVVHMLGFGFDPADRALQAANTVANQVWAANQRRWVDELAAQGFDVSCQRDFADGPVRLPVLIERLCRSGVASGDPVQCHALFRAFFAALPAAAYDLLQEPIEAARVLADAGGIAIAAHPLSIAPAHVPEILSVCDGLEALYAPYNGSQRQALLELCERSGKLYTCGSDYHGYFTAHYQNPKLVLPRELEKRFSKRGALHQNKS